MRKAFQEVYRAIYGDKFNRWAVLAGVIGALIAYLIWRKLGSSSFFSFYSPYGYYPMQMLLVVWLLHLAIAAYSYKIDRKISHLMTSALTFYALLIIVLEIYYWTTL